MSTTARDHFDLVVIGAGPAGEKGAAQAASFGKRVCIIERAPKPGGAAINTGTIPSKTLRETALHFSTLRRRGIQGVDYTVKPDITIADFMQRERTIAQSEWALIEHNLRSHHVTTIQGSARFLDPTTVEVSRYKQPPRQITGDVFLIATGSAPLRPPEIPFDDAIVDSDGLLRLQSIPRTLVVLGGGVIGCEYACMFAALGVRVTLLTARERLLTQLDIEVSDALRRQMTARLGIAVLLDTEVTRVARDHAEVHVTLSDGTVLGSDCVLVSTARVGCTEALDLPSAGVRTTALGHIVVGRDYRTSVSHIYAAGDVIGFPALASTSIEQARLAMCHAFDRGYVNGAPAVMPYAVYTIPEISMVGVTEERARAAGERIEVGRASYRSCARGQIIGDVDGLVKLVFRAEDQRLLGASVIGEDASELIHLAMLCLMQECTIDVFVRSVFNYPSLSETFKYAAFDGVQRLARRSGEPRLVESQPEEIAVHAGSPEVPQAAQGPGAPP